MDEGKIIKVVLVNLSQRGAIDMWPVYVDQKEEGKTTLCVAMIQYYNAIFSCRHVYLNVLVIFVQFFYNKCDIVVYCMCPHTTVYAISY